MALRREAAPPQTVIDSLSRRLEGLERRIRLLRQPGRSSFPLQDKDLQIDPIQGEFIVHHPGDHSVALPASGVRYYHDDEWRTPGARAPNWWARADIDGGVDIPAPTVPNLVDWAPSQLSNFEESEQNAEDLALRFINNNGGVLSLQGGVQKAIDINETGLWLLEINYTWGLGSGGTQPLGYYGGGLSRSGSGSLALWAREDYSKHATDTVQLRVQATEILTVGNIFSDNDYFPTFAHTIVGNDIAFLGGSMSITYMGHVNQ